MAPTYLDDIVAWHRARASEDLRDWRERLGVVSYEGPSLLDALRDPSNPNVKVIAEVKRRSPSKGWIDEHVDAARLAMVYQRGGATAVSVLTDEKYFSGSVEDLTSVRAAVDLPLLRKDFTVSANDVLDAAAMGASCVLLIVAALDDEELRLFLHVAEHSGIDALVEVHDDREARRALDCGATLVGVNQRDLRSFQVDTDQAVAVMSSLPRDIVTVAESGLATPHDVRRAGDAGFDAVLVGEAFIRSPHREELVRSFASLPRVQRA